MKQPASEGNDPDLVAASEPTHEELEMCEALEYEDPDDLEPVDADKTAHDKQAVATVRTEAVSIAKTKYNIELNTDEAQTAVGLFPKVSFSRTSGKLLLTCIWNRLWDWLENLTSRNPFN